MTGDGTALLSCNNVVRKMEKPQGKAWEVKLAPGSNIPFITDGIVKKWCMEVFQEEVEQAGSASGPPQLDLDKIDNPAEPASTKMVALNQQTTASDDSAGVAGVGDVKAATGLIQSQAVSVMPL